MKHKASVSVVVPAYKAAGTLPMTLDSLLYDRSPVNQIIVVEDGIFDGTYKVLERYRQVTHLPLPVNKGAAHARNEGLKLAINDFVMFIDADDYVRPGLIEGLLIVIEGTSADVALGPCLSFWPSTGKRYLYQPPLSDQQDGHGVALRWLKGDSGPGTCSILWRKSSINKIDGWDETLIRNQDGELAIRAALMGLSFAISKQSYSVYIKSSNESISKNVSDAAFASLLKVGEKIDSIISDYNDREDFKVALKCYWARSALLAYKNGKNDYANNFRSRAGLAGFIEMKAPAWYKFIIILMGPRRASLFWDWLIQKKQKFSSGMNKFSKASNRGE